MKDKAKHKIYYRNYFRNNEEQKEKNKLRRKIRYWKKKLNELADKAQVCIIPYPKNLDEFQRACKALQEYTIIKEQKIKASET